MSAAARPQDTPSHTGLWMHPLPWMLGAAAAALLALGSVLVVGEAGTPFRAVVLFLSLLAAGRAVVCRPNSAAVLAGAAGVGLLGWLALGRWEHASWDSIRYLLAFLTAVAAGAAVLVLLPRVLRRILVSGIILFHFVAILSTVFGVPPAPWLATASWTYLFRPYLDFMYLNNAYHFYSPDPGPPNLLWFRLEYEDGSRRWIKIPNKHDYPTSVNYQRRLSLTEYTSHTKMTDPIEMEWRNQRRRSVADLYPYHPQVPLVVQFREPNRNAKRILENYARYVARSERAEGGRIENPSYEGTAGKVVKVRIYRVVHEIPDARALANGVHPLDLWLYKPYYQGEYDAEGNLLNPNDPMLYWLVPIIKKDIHTSAFAIYSESLDRIDPDDGRTYEVYDFLKRHAGNYRPEL